MQKIKNFFSNANTLFEENLSSNKEQQAISYKEPRNAMFDLVRIFAMFLIVSVHFMGHGGWINNMVGVNLVLAKILRSIFYPAVDVFVLISAYYTCKGNGKINWKRLGLLYAELWFYSMLLFTVATLTKIQSFSVTALLTSLFPLVSGKYWFFSAYVFFSLSTPLLNILVRKITQKQHIIIACVGLILGSLSSDLNIVQQLGLTRGYSYLWFVILYFVGSYIRFYNIKITRKTAFIPIILYCVTIIVGYFVSVGHSSILSSIGAILIILGCKHIRIEASFVSKTITRISGLMFGVYLIHDSPELRRFMYDNIFHCSRYYTNKYAFLILISFISLTFVVCAVAEFIRKQGEKLIVYCVEKRIKNSHSSN